jgi:predicted ferric reductase
MSGFFTFSSSFSLSNPPIKMLHPWDFDPSWEESGATYYNVTPGMPEFQDYYDTVAAYYYNSMRVPTVAGFAILAMFVGVVLVAGIQRLIEEVPSVHRWVRKCALIRLWNKHIAQAPLFGKRHVETVGPAFISLKLPLRGQTLLLAALTIVNLIPIVAFYKPFRKNNLYWPDRFVEIGRYFADRTGILATAQFPPLILLSGRNNPVTWITGATFETCMLYHRWIARLVFLQILLHALGYTLISLREGGVAEFHELFIDPYFRWGCVATVAFGPLIFFSLRYLRRASYEFFVLVHVVMAIIAIVGTFYHIHLLAVVESGRFRDFDNWIYASIAFYCLDKIVRIIRVVAYSVGPGLSLSTVEVDEMHIGQRSIILRHKIHLVGYGAKHANSLSKKASKYVQLWIPTIQPFSSHPFTVADIKEDCVYLYVKKHKGITSTLHDRINKSVERKTSHVALFDGFYGDTCSIEHYQKSLLIAGGIGITQCLPLFLRAAKAGKDVELFWVIPERGMMKVLIDVLQREQNLVPAEEEGGNRAKLTIHVTRVDLSEENTSDSDLTKDTDEKEGGEEIISKDASQISLEKVCQALDVQIRLQGEDGRPNVGKLVSESNAELVVSCGPAGLCDDIRTVRGNFEYVEESFEW